MNRRVVVVPDAAAVARTTASRLLLTLVDAQSVHTPVHVALTGGGVGIATLAAVADDPLLDLVEWGGVHLWWSDERFLPTGDPERNETGARQALLDRIADRLPPENVHPVPGPGPEVPDAETAANLYADALEDMAPFGAPVPEFDIALLGLGPDGHVASLFPDHPATRVHDVSVTAVHDSPKPPPTRVSFTLPTIRAARRVWVVAAGAAKADAAAHALHGGIPADIPAAGAVGRAETVWLLDTAAAEV
jgi:6-phosphogluconolactonase